MTGQVNFDIDYKALVREKLLDAYENNPLVLEKILQLREKANLIEYSQYNGQMIAFLNRYYLAGIIVALCPEATNFITTVLEFNSDLFSVLNTIGLNFDPRPELEKRAEERKLAQEATLVQNNNVIGLLSEDPEYRAVQEGLEEIRAQMKQLENSS
ncbi:MAG: DUF5331 domain-containing protein [Woronichinia naegeliana WA131]|jgi:hypothetical protein|uniref:DUF5331 domain-containing protein n=1 Tax=Woronichinia naegeliana WA131 TaxID=2824559 RepID=A0A977L070_9CYAN|nr:MAG: DUF5331 domain-containing protein [Woronichinia naegeliana WA131]